VKCHSDTRNTIVFKIPLIPVAQMRARHGAIKTKTGAVFSRTYKASKEVRREAQIMELLAEHKPDEPLTGPVILSVIAYLPIPKSWPQWKRDAANQDIIRHKSKPDLDNLLKFIMDCMTQMNFWGDDSQICEFGITKKQYSISPRWVISISEFFEPENKRDYDEHWAEQEIREDTL